MEVCQISHRVQECVLTATRRKQSWGAYLGARPHGSPVQTFAGAHDPPTPSLDPGQGAIGWSLTGTMNSPKNASLAVLYPTNARDVATNPVHSPILPNPPILQTPMVPPFPRQQSGPLTNMANPPPNFASPQVDASRIQDADLLLNLTHSPYNQSSPQLPNGRMPHISNQNSGFVDQSVSQQQTEYQRMQEQGGVPYANMMIESQDIDMSVLGDDMMWLEYLPSEPLNFYGGNHGV
jgi:hypothetical protein